MIRYAKVRLQGQRRWILLEVASESDRILIGYEIGQDGGRIQPAGCDEQGRRYDQRQRIVDKALIAKRTEMSMNLKYGELEEAH